MDTDQTVLPLPVVLFECLLPEGISINTPQEAFYTLRKVTRDIQNESK